ncbi:calponin homology domain-containing protein DDB_G0272472-like [Mytilus trossulus]|uniref:calponin homology domain-containing protein DDB_G0272472-like n=1 Tax=Mytilus trossulus TaxID=6551 RepID=UPI0030059875
MEIHSSSLEWNVRNLMLSLLHVAFGEIEANVMSGAQLDNCKEIEIPQNYRESERVGNEYERSAFLKDVNNSESTEALDLKDEKEITSTDEECAAFYKSVRDAEYNKLVDAYTREKATKEEKERNLIAREQEKVDSTEVKGEYADFYKSVRDAEYNKLVEAYVKERIMKEEREAYTKTREQEKVDSSEVISAKEITDEDECAAFYKSVRDAEYNKLVESYARENIIKEEKEKNRMTREQEKIKKQFEEFWEPTTNIDSLRHVSQKDNEKNACTPQQELHFKVDPVQNRQTGPFLSPVKEERIKSFVREQHCNYQSFQNTDMRNATINRELDTAVTISETVPNKRSSFQRIVNRVFKRSKPSTKDINDNQRALKEELKLDLSTLDDNTEDEDIPDTSRTSDSEWFSISLSDTEETPRPHLRPFFSPLVDEIQGSTNTSKTKESAIDIEVGFQSKPNSRFTGFRQWFCQLFCCRSKPDKDVDNYV